MSTWIARSASPDSSSPVWRTRSCAPVPSADLGSSAMASHSPCNSWFPRFHSPSNRWIGRPFSQNAEPNSAGAHPRWPIYCIRTLRGRMPSLDYSNSICRGMWPRWVLSARDLCAHRSNSVTVRSMRSSIWFSPVSSRRWCAPISDFGLNDTSSCAPLRSPTKWHSLFRCARILGCRYQRSDPMVRMSSGRSTFPIFAKFLAIRCLWNLAKCACRTQVNQNEYFREKTNERMDEVNLRLYVLRAGLCDARMQFVCSLEYLRQRTLDAWQYIRTACLIRQLLCLLKQRIEIHFAERKLRLFRNELPTKCCWQSET